MNQLMIVRRGQLERFVSLRGTFGGEPIRAQIIWDRRQGERRTSSDTAVTERRLRARRGAPPCTWTALDFVVVRNEGDNGRMEVVERDEPSPASGDLLIRRELSPKGPCTISRVPEPAHALFGSYEIALVQAQTQAKQLGVDLWYTEDHHRFNAVRRFRHAEDPR
jgi:hypothetical protein